MSTCRKTMSGLALMLTAMNAAYCQAPMATPGGSFRYAHTAYPETSYPPTTGVTKSTTISDRTPNEEYTSAATSRAAINDTTPEEGRESTLSKEMPSFTQWFSKSYATTPGSTAEHATAADVVANPEAEPAMAAIPSLDTPAATEVSSIAITNVPTSGEESATRNLQVTVQPDGMPSFGKWFTRSYGEEPSTTANGPQPLPSAQALAGDLESDAEVVHSAADASAAMPTSGEGSLDASKTSVSGAFAGILGDEPKEQPRRDKIQTVQATTSDASEAQKVIPAVGGIEGPPVLNAPKQALATSPSAENPLHRPKLIFQPVAGGVDSRGNALLRPSVQVAPSRHSSVEGEDIQLTQFPGEEPLPIGVPGPMASPEMAYPVDEEWMPPVVYDAPCADCEGGSGGFFHGMHGRQTNQCPGQTGVGREYVMHAPFFIDRTQPFNHCAVRADAAKNWQFPDRAEYFWARTPGGKGPVDPFDPPQAEPSVNYQDVVFSIEKGWERFSINTEIPIRAVDPDIRLNTAGLADMEVTTRTVLLDGCRFQLSQIFSTHLPTGSYSRGTGNGHVSLEPGIAYRYKINDNTYFHGDLTYLFPIGADPDFAGQILNYGLALSHVWIDTDTYAIIPTIEVDCWTVLDGRESLPGIDFNENDPLANSQEIDSMGIVNVHPGLRWVCDKGGDCGVKEFGISSGICVTQDTWYEELVRIEFRWSR